MCPETAGALVLRTTEFFKCVAGTAEALVVRTTAFFKCVQENERVGFEGDDKRAFLV